MNLPQPPTDNLYKFVAIAGLVGCVMLLIVCFQRVDALDSQVNALELEAVSVRAERAVAEDRMPRLEADVNRVAGEILAKRHDSSVKERLWDVLARTESLKIALDVVQMREGELRTKVSQFHEHTRDARWLVNYLMFLALGCAVAAGYGFFNWYHRLQKWQDRLVEVEAASREQDKPQAK